MLDLSKTQSSSEAKSRLSHITGLGVDMTRRALLGGTATGAAAMTLGALWSDSALAASTSLQTRSDLLMLVHRLLPGYSLAEFQLAQSMGFSAYRTSKLYPGTLNDSALDNFLAPLGGYINAVPYDFLPPPVIGPHLDLGIASFVMQLNTIYRSVLSKYQFRERITECWRDHFNIYIPKGGVVWGGPWFDKSVLRTYADDTFPNLFEAVERTGSMLFYLDNQLNVAPVANENLAREILELHSLSPIDYVTGQSNYAQADVLAFAQCISGWTVDMANVTPAQFGFYTFNGNAHIGGNKNFLGVTIPGNSSAPSEGDHVLGILCRHPATATFVAYKLCRFFLQYAPPPSLVTQIAFIYLTSGGDIRTMVQAILSQTNLATLNPSTGPVLKLSLPGHWFERILIALGLTVNEFDPAKKGVMDELQILGNAPYHWAPPDGYPDKEEAWASSIFARWQTAAKLFANPSGVDGVTISDTLLLNLISPFVTTMDVVNNIDSVLLGGVMTANEKAILDAYINFTLTLSPPVNPFQIVREIFALAVSTPSFMYY